MPAYAINPQYVPKRSKGIGVMIWMRPGAAAMWKVKGVLVPCRIVKKDNGMVVVRRFWPSGWADFRAKPENLRPTRLHAPHGQRGA